MAEHVRVSAVDRPDVPSIDMPMRFRREVVYFMTPADTSDAPKLSDHEYWIEAANVERWLDDGGFTVVSPLDAESVAEIELTEDQERWLEWMKQYAIDRIRVE